MRTRVLFALSVFLLASVRGVPAQAPAPASGCTAPDSPAQVATAAVPEAPPLAIEQGISGTVTIRVRLDAAAHVLESTIVQSPSSLLDTAALATIRKDTFAPAVQDCVATPAVLNVAVPFPTAVTTGSVPDIAAFFTGTWYCGTARNAQAVEAFGRDAFGGRVLVLFGSSVSVNDTVESHLQRYSESNGTTTVTAEFAGRLFVGTSRGWNGNRLVFSGDLTVAPRSDAALPVLPAPMLERMTYVRLDHDHFQRIFEVARTDDGPWTQTATGTCARIAPAAAN